jgi:hypothetical protein
MMFTKSMILFSFSALFGLVSSLVLADSKSALTAEQFEKLRGLIKPHPGEDKWAEIPWTSQLWDARRQAAAQGKPILLWEMDGNPLGCG